MPQQMLSVQPQGQPPPGGPPQGGLAAMAQGPPQQGPPPDQQQGPPPDQQPQDQQQEQGPPNFDQGAASFQQQQKLGVLQQLVMRQQQVARDAAMLHMGRALMRGVKDQPTYEVFKGLIAAMFGPQAAQGLGQSYEDAKPTLAVMMAHSATVERHVYAHLRSMKLMKAALTGKGDPHELWKGAVGNALATARSNGEWAGTLGEMSKAGAPKHVLNQFDTVYSPDGASKAQALAGPHALPSFSPEEEENG